MSRILVIFATTEGQTRKIAHHIADRLRDADHDVDVCEYSRFAQNVGFSPYEAIVAGAPLYLGRHSTGFRRLMQKQVDCLNNKPSAFFSVSLSAAGDEMQQNDARRCLNAFLLQTGWNPDCTAIIAGALLYRQFGFFKRWLLKWVVARAYGHTDTSKNYEFTNWAEVDRFADEFAGELVPVENHVRKHVAI